MMDIKSFLHRNRMTKAELCRRLGVGPKSSLLNAYEKGLSNPSFEICEKLIPLGITAQELFGEELGKILVENSVISLQIPPGGDSIHIDLQDLKFLELVEKALLRIEERKKQGIIK